MVSHHPDLAFGRTPRYVEYAPDMLLIGVTHATLNRAAEDGIGKDEITAKLATLEHRLAGISHLGVESDEYNWRTINSMNPNTFEGFTSRNFKGQFVYLDENSDYVDALAVRGVSPSLLGMMTMFTAYPYIRANSPDCECFLLNMTASLRQGKQIASGYRGIDVETVLGKLPNIFSFLMSRPELLRGCLDAAIKFEIDYLQGLRDHLFYAPKIKEMQSLDGSKGVMIGNAHIDQIAECLAAGAPARYQYWFQFKLKQDRKTQSMIALIEAMDKNILNSNHAKNSPHPV